VAANGVSEASTPQRFRGDQAGPAPGRKAARAGARFPDGSLTWNFWATHDARHQKKLGANERSPTRKKIPDNALLVTLRQ
jgi:hypothetical protein